MSILLSENVLYVRTVEASRKQPPKMQRLSGRLREVVIYKNRTTRGTLLRSDPGTSALWNIIYRMQCLS